ncbi:unnamed protein product, partial [Mesorhabditis belari]|uniref:Uncharacterized protein n=1 Tax=Mesorhabditis belari TaxID=2138241 RepID=A0AAF3EYR0_9BILA
MPSYPPIVYYRDTFGLDTSDMKRSDSMTTCSDDSITTKSTVRGLNIHAINPMYGSNGSRATNMTQSYHIEQVITDQVLFTHPRSLLILTLIMFASAIQLLIFSVICVFYDGCPFYIIPIVAGILFINTLIIFSFQKYWPTRGMLYVSCIAAALSFIESVALFFYCAYLINQEDKYIDRLGHRPNRIVASTRIAMYSLHMIFAPIHGVVSLVCAILLIRNLKELNENKVTRAYFMTEPQMGHQKILVPIEVRHVRDVDDDSLDAASIGVQTSGTRTHIV